MKTSTKVKKILIAISDKFLFELNNKKNRTIFKKSVETKLKEANIDFTKVVIESGDDSSLYGQVHFKNAPKRMPNSIHVVDFTVCPCIKK